MSFLAGGGKLRAQGTGNLQAAFDGIFQRAVENYDRKIDAIMISMNEKILERTPVWEGDTIHNWRWSTRAPSNGYAPPIENPVEPGSTNFMPLGVEPRRKANEQRPRQSLRAALRAKDPVDIYLTNTSDTAWDLEYGRLPTKDRSRTPAGGIVRLAAKEAMMGL